MHIIRFVLPLLILTACSQPAAPPGAEEPHAEAPTPTAHALTTGLMGAMSNTAMGLTGAVTVTADDLQFERGFTAVTQYIGPIEASSAVAKDGQTFADAGSVAPSAQIELRRIVPQAPAQLCGSVRPATYIALAHDDPITGLTLIVFSGADAPGPDAEDSAVCATFSYAVD